MKYIRQALYSLNMSSFDKTNVYYFTGPITKIEKYKIMREEPSTDGKIFLGNFVEYISFPWVGDWLCDAKAVFENGIIFQDEYSKVILGEIPPPLPSPLPLQPPRF